MKSLLHLAGDAIAGRPKLTRRPVLWLTLAWQPLAMVLLWPAIAGAKPPLSPAAARLDKMFSPEIQAIGNACDQQGLVNLAAGADPDGSVICGNGWRQSPVQYTAYLDFVTQFLAAGFLVGLQAGLKSTPDFKPELATAVLSSPDAVQSFREALQQSIISSEIVAKGSTRSVRLLTDRVMPLILPFLREPAKLNTLFGTGAEYTKIAQNFCTPPGMPIAQAQRLAPNLLPMQIYAICFQEAGLVDEVTRARPPRSPGKPR